MERSIIIRHLRETLKVGYEFKTCSDCEIIIPLYLQYGEDCIQYLDGKFSFALHDGRKNKYFATRDPIGVTSLYQGKRWLDLVCFRIEVFEPGTVYSSELGKYRWHNPAWLNPVIHNKEKKMIPQPTHPI